MACETVNKPAKRDIELYLNENKHSSVLNLSEYNLTTLPNLSDFACNKLDVSKNKLTNVNVANLPNKLKQLNCSYNLLTFLDVSVLKIDCLDCSNNDLCDLRLCPSLKKLNCYYNKLTAVSINCPNLEELHCESNALEVLDVENLHKLTKLCCSNNKLKNVYKLPDSIKILNLATNELTELNNFPQDAIYIDCSQNALYDLPLFPESLKSLICHSNKLTKLQPFTHSLTMVSCKNNYLIECPNFGDCVCYY